MARSSLRHRGDFLAGEAVAAARRPIETTERVHERRFAGAGRADEGHEIALGNSERDLAQGSHLDFPQVVHFADVAENDQI